MEREQIIKALECCSQKSADCKVCPLYDVKSCFTRVIIENALSLIKELTEENEAWQKQLITTKEKFDKAYYELACEVEDLRKQNERLTEENERLHASCTELTRKCASLNKENEMLEDKK